MWVRPGPPSQEPDTAGLPSAADDLLCRGERAAMASATLTGPPPFDDECSRLGNIPLDLPPISPLATSSETLSDRAAILSLIFPCISSFEDLDRIDIPLFESVDYCLQPQLRNRKVCRESFLRQRRLIQKTALSIGPAYNRRGVDCGLAKSLRGREAAAEAMS